MNNSQALENKIGVSPAIIFFYEKLFTLTSSSSFIIFFILARGRELFLKYSGSSIKIKNLNNIKSQSKCLFQNFTTVYI